MLAKVGDHYININCNSYTFINMLKRNFQTNMNGHDIEFDLEITIKDGYGIPFLNYEVERKKQDDKIFFRRADYLIEVDCEYKSATISVNNELALKHALMNLYSSFIVYHKWGLLIHSSCAIEQGQAHVFVGHSGAGKSTAAKLSYPRNLLSDEATLVKISEDKVTVFNSPFRSEIESSFYEEEILLASLNLLNQANHIERTKLKKSDALLNLMDKVFAWPYNPEETKTILKLLSVLVQNVPAYELHFQKNNTFWELIS
jgi:hypothetical protein